MALLSRYNYAPKDINDGVHVWADCSQSMLDTVDPDAAIAYIRSRRNHKVPPQFGERDVTLLEEYTEAGLSIGTLGACAMTARTGNRFYDWVCHITDWHSCCCLRPSYVGRPWAL